jgi:hypothetical protein
MLPNEERQDGDYFVFADETGTHDGCECYGIGCFCLSAAGLERCAEQIGGILTTYRIEQELKWTRIGDFNATSRAAFESVECLLRAGATFNAIIALKRAFNYWRQDEEKGFWVTYHELLRHVARQRAGRYSVIIDDRDDRYPLRDEVLELTTNHYLRGADPGEHIVRVHRADSHEHRILQCADILTGAITATTARALNPHFPMNEGKLRLSARFAALMGLDGLHHDTWPNGIFNVWHFPLEFRGTFPTRKAVLAAPGQI